MTLARDERAGVLRCASLHRGLLGPDFAFGMAFPGYAPVSRSSLVGTVRFNDDGAAHSCP